MRVRTCVRQHNQRTASMPPPAYPPSPALPEPCRKRDIARPYIEKGLMSGSIYMLGEAIACGLFFHRDTGYGTKMNANTAPQSCLTKPMLFLVFGKARTMRTRVDPDPVPSAPARASAHTHTHTHTHTHAHTHAHTHTHTHTHTHVYIYSNKHTYANGVASDGSRRKQCGNATTRSATSRSTTPERSMPPSARAAITSTRTLTVTIHDRVKPTPSPAFHLPSPRLRFRKLKFNTFLSCHGECAVA